MITDARLVDLRDDAATAALGIDTAHRAIEWQTLRAAGQHTPTCDLAERMRALDGMLYASCSDPIKTHLTLFRWNEDASMARVTQTGDAIFVET